MGWPWKFPWGKKVEIKIGQVWRAKNGDPWDSSPYLFIVDTRPGWVRYTLGWSDLKFSKEEYLLRLFYTLVEVKVRRCNAPEKMHTKTGIGEEKS